MTRRRRSAGVTLMEVLIAVTLLSLLTTGMVLAMRIGLNVFAKTNTRLMGNRRVAGAQRVLEQELAGLVPVVAACAGAPRSSASSRASRPTCASSPRSPSGRDGADSRS